METGDGQVRRGELEGLTPRERQVLELVAEGRTSKEIGEVLHISRRTVDVYRTHLRLKLGVRNVAEMVMAALRK